MNKAFIINRQGKDFITYPGLLDEAHTQGLKRITTTLLQVPSKDNGGIAIVIAEVETAKGTFTGIGDASSDNVGRMIAPHIIRMAETRSKARALRDAVNVGMTSIEELGDDTVETPSGNRVNKATGEKVDEPLHNAPTTQNQTMREMEERPKASPNKPALANQIATALKLAKLVGAEPEDYESMSSAQVSDKITEYSRLYNESKTRKSA